MAQGLGRPGPIPRPAADTAAHPGRRILIVEDLLDAATTLRLLLEMSGHTVEVAHDGRPGWKRRTGSTRDHPVRHRPARHLDGYNVARTIRRTPGLEKVHLIAMTGFGSEGAKDESWKAGFDLHLTKPVDPEALAQVIARLPDL